MTLIDSVVTGTRLSAVRVIKEALPRGGGASERLRRTIHSCDATSRQIDADMAPASSTMTMSISGTTLSRNVASTSLTHRLRRRRLRRRLDSRGPIDHNRFDHLGIHQTAPSYRGGYTTLRRRHLRRRLDAHHHELTSREFRRRQRRRHLRRRSTLTITTRPSRGIPSTPAAAHHEQVPSATLKD